MDGGIDHDSTIDIDLDNLLSLLVVCQTLMATIIDTLKRYEFLASLDEISSKFSLILVVLQRIAVKTGDLSRSFECWHITIHGSY